MVFPRTMTEHGHKLEDDAIVLVKARIDKRDDMPKLIAMEIEVVEGVSDSATPFRLRVMPNRLTADLIAQLKEILLEHPGDHPVLLHLGDDKVLRLPPAYGGRRRHRAGLRDPGAARPAPPSSSRAHSCSA